MGRLFKTKQNSEQERQEAFSFGRAKRFPIDKLLLISGHQSSW